MKNSSTYISSTPPILENSCVFDSRVSRLSSVCDSTSPKNIINFTSKGISVLEKLSEIELSDMIKYANNSYYNTEKVLTGIKDTAIPDVKNEIELTDNEYDILKEFFFEKYPTNILNKQVGATPIIKNKVKLPFEMASMNKIKPDSNALDNWKTKFKGPYLISCKLDGVSGLYINENGTHKLYTRGDGIVGQDISHFINILKLPILKNGFAVRGEFILPKHIFEEKYKNTFANARNLVSGIINSKIIDSKTMDLHFLTYELISPAHSPSEQLTLLELLKFNTVTYKSLFSITNEQLSDILVEWRSNYKYEIDGVIITDDHLYNRTSGNPEHAFAFKMVISDQVAEAKVVDVIWTPSKNGYLKPRVRIEPIKIGGVNIEYATGFNGRFIEENKIGIGAVIQLVRSGDVIPFIKSVTIPAEKAKMPDVPYIWTDSKVDVILENVETDTIVREKLVTLFFVSLNVEGLSSGNIHRLFEAGFDSIFKIINMTISDFEKVDGFKKKMSEKIKKSIHEKIENASLLNIMVASNKLGRGIGERKLKLILDHFPDIFISGPSSISQLQKIALLQTIKGIGIENASEFVYNIDDFLKFLKDCGLENKLTRQSLLSSTPEFKGEVESQTELRRETLKSQTKEFTGETSSATPSTHPLNKKKIVMTKIRDKNIIESLSKVGATLEDRITEDTFVLIVKSKDDNSNKTELARKKGIHIMTPEEFIETYL